MKNILAENMLRFGAKNLKESDVKRIERAVLSETFRDKDGIIWPNCADQAAADNITAILEKIPNVTGLVGKTIFGGDGVTTLNATTVLQYTGATTLEFNLALCYSLVMDPNYKTPVLSSYMTNIVKMMSAAKGNMERLSQVGSTVQFNWIEIFGTLYKSETQKWWDTEIMFKTTPTAQPERISRWSLYKRTFLDPTTKQLAPFLTKSTPAKPGAPSVQPNSTKTVPGKI
jgi:hypothetical protein